MLICTDVLQVRESQWLGKALRRQGAREEEEDKAATRHKPGTARKPQKLAVDGLEFETGGQEGDAEESDEEADDKEELGGCATCNYNPKFSTSSPTICHATSSPWSSIIFILLLETKIPSVLITLIPSHETSLRLMHRNSRPCQHHQPPK